MWKNGGRQPLATAFKTFEEYVSLKCPRYFEALEYTPLNDLAKYEDLQYLDSCIPYCENHSVGHAHLRNGGGDELLEAETAFVLGVKERYEQVRLISFHLALNCSLDTHFRKDWNDPSPTVTYILWDHKAKPIYIYDSVHNLTHTQIQRITAHGKTKGELQDTLIFIDKTSILGPHTGGLPGGPKVQGRVGLWAQLRNDFGTPPTPVVYPVVQKIGAPSIAFQPTAF